MAIRFGSFRDDVLIGTDATDILFGLDGDDVLFGLGGDDLLFGGSGHDFLDGGDGNDVLSGDSGHDTLNGGAGSDFVLGGDGNDTLIGGPDNDTMVGGPGDDNYKIALGSGNDALIDTAGTDTLFINGNPFVLDDVRRSGNNLVIRLDDGTEATVLGHYTGNALEGVEFPGVGFPALATTFAIATGFTGTTGAGDHDEIFVGTNAGETIDAGDGADWLFGHGGDDTLLGGTGDDYIEGGAGADLIDGGPQDGLAFGADFAAYAHSDAAVSIDLGAGTASGGHATGDMLFNIEGVIGSDFADTLIGRNAADDRFMGRGGDDFINGLTGFDLVDYVESPNGVTVDLSMGTASDGWGSTDTLMSIERVHGSEFNDVLIGSDTTLVAEFFRGRTGDDFIDGKGGFDLADYSITQGPVDVNLATGIALDGSGGTDTLINVERIRGSAFDDTLTGNAASNVIQGLSGDDVIDGGAGTFDAADYSVDAGFGGTGGVTANLVTGMATDGFGDTDTLVNIENVIGTNAVDLLMGDGSANFLNGLRGNDALIGGAGNDSFQGGGGNDLIDGGEGVDTMIYSVDVSLGGPGGVSVNLSAGTAIDGFGNVDTLISVENVFGSLFGDLLIGDGNANLLLGQAGNDVLDGGAGNDQLLGGLGDDLFVFQDGSGNDLVSDFVAGAGSPDRLDLTAFGFADFDAVLAAANTVGSNVVIQLDVDDSVTLLGVQEAQLHPNDVLI